MTNSSSIKSFSNRENIIYLFIWLMVLSLPVFTLRGDDQFSWTQAVLEWVRMLPFLLIFIINNSLLVPKLLFKKKTVQYISYLSVIIIVISLLSENLIFINELLNGNGYPPPPPHGQPPHLRGGPPQAFGPRFMDKIFVSFLVVGFNTAIKLVFQRQQEEQQQEEREKIHLQTELSFLRQQISPHFFMNTLNNIHALIDFDTDLAKDSVIQLSKLMRYLLEGSQNGKATIKEEFDFLRSYIDLMKLRYSDKVKIAVDLNIEDNKKQIPALLFVSVVENAFKYGVSSTDPSFIEIHAKKKENYLIFEIRNSKAAKNNSDTGTGLGLVNLRKQLDLLYESNYKIEIDESENEFSVQLEIPLNHD